MEYILIIVSVIIIFILGRKVNLWYFRINEMIDNQNETNRLLKKIAGEKEPESPVIIEEEQKKSSVEEFNRTRYGS